MPPKINRFQQLHQTNPKSQRTQKLELSRASRHSELGEAKAEMQTTVLNI